MGNDLRIGTLQQQSLVFANAESAVREARAEAQPEQPAPPASGVTRDFPLTRTVNGTTESYTLTITNLPAHWNWHETMQVVELIARLNTYADTPMTRLIINPQLRSQANLERHCITMNTRDTVDITGALGTVAHEMGHWVARNGPDSKFMGNPQMQALRGLMRFHPQAKEIVDDSNFAPIREAYGHPEEESFDGSATFTAIRAEQLRHFLERDDTPQYVRDYGTAVYLAMRETLFRGDDFNADGAAIAAGAPPLDTLMASLFKQAEAAIPDLIANAKDWDNQDTAAALRMMAAAHPAADATISQLITCGLDAIAHGDTFAGQSIIERLINPYADEPGSEEEAALSHCPVPSNWKTIAEQLIQQRLDGPLPEEIRSALQQLLQHTR